MIVAITGGRDYDDRETLNQVLDDLHHGDTGPITLVRNGGMTGADALSSRWAYQRQVDTECVGALWGQHGSAAGPLRNFVMLTEPSRADVVVAFPGGRGTANCVNQARRLVIEVVEVQS